MKKIKPQPLHESDYAGMEAQLKKIFFDIIFRPVLDLILPHNAQMKSAVKEMKNAATSAVVAALKAGKIQYASGIFSGDFNATTTKEIKAMGATWNKQTKTFALKPNMLPPDVFAMASAYEETAKKLHTELERRLSEIEVNLSDLVDAHPVDAVVTVGNVQEGFKKSAGAVLGDAESDLSEEGKLRLAAEYTESIKPYIAKFSKDTVQDLREMVAANGKEGYRFDRLIEQIQYRYGVSQNKAKFLAQQETSMLVSKHRRVRFEDIGITRYIWRTSGKSSVRDDHRKLNGREFSYDDPPIVDSATGRRGNPGMDFGCQCVDEPVIPTMVEVAA